MELLDLGRTIEQQLYGSHRALNDHPFFASHPDLIGRLVSKLAYCVRDEPVRYIAVDMSQAEDAQSFSIALYTDDHVFYLVYEPTVDHITTSILGRRSVQMIEVLAAENFMATDSPTAARGAVSVAASYPGFKVRLPGDSNASEDNRSQLDVFLPSLLRDLNN